MIYCPYTRVLLDQLANICAEYADERITLRECRIRCKVIRDAVRQHAEISGH